MGLSGRKVKQRIGNDPRNLAWSDSAARFGHTYLSKLGWSESTGLGANLDGRTAHISVAHKLDMLGIGANRADGPEAIAWKQNKEFEGVLERLNKAQQEDSEEAPAESTISEALTGDCASASGDDDPAKRKEQKRLRKEARQRRRDEKRSMKEKDGSVTPGVLSSSVPTEPRKVMHLAHRARNRAAKGMLGASATALAEVLGESSSAAPSGSATPKPTLTPINEPQDELITTSTINMADYFQSRIRAKLGMPAPESPSPTYDDNDAPRGGLGSSSRGFGHSSNSYGPPRATFKPDTATLVPGGFVKPQAADPADDRPEGDPKVPRELEKKVKEDTALEIAGDEARPSKRKRRRLAESHEVGGEDVKSKKAKA